MSSTQSAPQLVEQELTTVIFYLTAFGYIDGQFDKSERDYIREFITRLVGYRARLALKDVDATLRAEQTERWTQHFQEVFGEIEQTIESYFTESVAEGEDTREFVTAKLKLRCYELFRQFSAENQSKLLLLADELITADGTVHESEARFRKELEELLNTQASAALEEDSHASGSIVIATPTNITPRLDDYDFFQLFERHYERDREAFREQSRTDLQLIDKTIAAFEQKREAGRGKLTGKQTVADLRGTDAFLDGYVNVLQPKPDKDYELLVLGDLHGCYTCLKAALMQADFFAKVDANHLDPTKPEMKLVLLGDYIDRGRYSYNGILRTIMQLFLTVPEHVYILRGNHEFYIEYNGRIYGGVKPAEAIESLQAVASNDIFIAYKRLFEAMPNTMLFDRTMFVHGGIPRDHTVASKWTDLSTLNDPEVRFEMLWSDPSEADFIPEDLQKANARFPFGRRQFRSFIHKIGCTSLVRGHERVVEGIHPVYSDKDGTLITLFSAGGKGNNDLPEESNYREVTPMALTIKHRNGVSQFHPFLIDYEKYNRPEFNGFLRR